MNRRHFLNAAIAASLPGMTSFGSNRRHLTQPENIPVRTITKGPKHHWFGYYDKLQFDPTDRYILSNEVSFEHRTPRADDEIKVGMVDTFDDDRWIEIGKSRAWGWQQGCMLQWLPGSDREVIWNDRRSDSFVSHIFDVKSKSKRTLDRPIYTLANNGEFALTADFARIQIMRPGYGYVGLPDQNQDDVAPRDSGIFHVDLKNGTSRLVLSLADAAKIPHQGTLLTGVKHYFNHLLVAPNSKRFITLHRWRKYDAKSKKTTGGFITRMITANIDGSDVFVLDPSGYTSHFIWRDPEHVCMWTRPKGKKSAFYLFKDKTREVQIVGDGVMTRNGHNTYLPKPNGDWILNDTYPDKNRNQKPYLFHVPTGKQVWLGNFHSPKVYSGEWRCDTHPRSSNDGKTVCIDSPHKEEGRQLHLIDVSDIVEGN